MKMCNKCNCEKPTSEFYKKNTAKDGLFWWCRSCHKEYVKAKYHKLAESDEYREAERNRVNAFHEANPDKVKLWNRRYANENAPKVNAKAKRYVLARGRRTPTWLTPDDYWMIEQAYELAAMRTEMLGFPWHVDHVVPLHGRVVSGLHVPHNLQVIPAVVNRSKSNKFVTT